MGTWEVEKKDEGVFEAIGQRVTGVIPQEFEDILWAYGKVEKKDEGGFEVIGTRAMQENVLQQMTSHEPANILWVFGKVEQMDEGGLEVIGGDERPRIVFCTR